ncbi:MAG: hypothetical protein FWG44_01075 [Oscillospiraceae bacterium]|nr:hypothetical protein [Oscillospiraceae bacterium]
MKKILSIFVIVALAAIFTISTSAITTETEADGDTVKVFLIADEDGSLEGLIEVDYGDGLVFDFFESNSRAGEISLWVYNDDSGLLSFAGVGVDSGDILAYFVFTIADADGDLSISFTSVDRQNAYEFKGIEIFYSSDEILELYETVISDGQGDIATIGDEPEGNTCICEHCDKCGGCLDCEENCNCADCTPCVGHNPNSGVIFAVIPAFVSAGAAIITRKRK